ncbi:MAG: hypothetical protein JNL12_01245 [Planctomycetes bacterium]|nr:hypothetical protein [Planctomycetota bacterium]
MRSFPAFLFSAAIAAGLANQASAQRLVSYDPVTGAMAELQPPIVFLPVPNPPLAGYPSLPILPPPMAAMAGDATFDNLAGVTWFTNGGVLAAMPTPTFPPLFLPPAPVLPIPPAVLAAIGGPVSGIAIDPVGGPLGVMYLVSAPGIVIGVAPVPGLPVVVPPFPIGLLTGPISGLEWDGITGSLWAVDVGGVAYNFLVGGAPIAPPLPPAFPMVAPAGDIAIDKVATINPAGLRPLYISTGPMVFDTRDPTGVPFPSGPMGTGLAFMNHPAATPPAGACVCPAFFTPTNFTTSVMSSGNGAWGIGMTGLAPFGLAIFGFDAAFDPTFPLINGVGCPFGLFAPAIVLATADATGTIVAPIPLTLVPIGAGIYNQNASVCPTDPLGYVLTPMQWLVAGGF